MWQVYKMHWTSGRLSEHGSWPSYTGTPAGTLIATLPTREAAAQLAGLLMLDPTSETAMVYLHRKEGP